MKLETFNLEIEKGLQLGENMTDEELQEINDEADRNENCEISLEEFMRIMKKTNLFWHRYLI